MNLLTKEQALELKPGNRVRVLWFQPRKPKGPEVPSLEWGGRQQWFESAWENQEVAGEPYLPTCEEDGVLVKLTGRFGSWNALHMEKIV